MSLSIGSYITQGIRNFWSAEEGINPISSGYVLFLVQKSYSELLQAIVQGEETIKTAMIENLRKISTVLRGYRGFTNLLGAIESNFGNVHLDPKAINMERDYDDEVYQAILRTIRENSRMKAVVYDLGPMRLPEKTIQSREPYDLSPYYFVGKTDGKIHRAG